MLTVDDVVFQKPSDQKNYERACKIAHRIFRLTNRKGGIGVVTNAQRRVLSFEFIMDVNDTPVNFGICLTAEELLEKAKLYHQLMKDSVHDQDKILYVCAEKAKYNPRFRTILQDLMLVSECMRHLDQSTVSGQKKVLH